MLCAFTDFNILLEGLLDMGTNASMKLAKCKKPFLSLRKILLLVLCVTVLFLAYLISKKKFFSICTYDNLACSMFTALITVSSIWVACYLLLLQLYKDRYPLKMVREKNQGEVKYIFALIISSILLGNLAILFSKNVILSIYFSLYASFVIIYIFITVYNANKFLMTNTYIDSYCKKFTNSLDNSTCPIDEKLLQEVQLTFDESIAKEEYPTAQNITEQAGTIFRDFLKSSPKMLDYKRSPKDIDSLFNKIVEFNIYQLDISDKIKSDILVEKIILQNCKNLIFCIDSGHYDWFKHYTTKLDALVFKTQRDKRESIPKSMLTIYVNIIKYLIKCQKQEWLEFIINDLHNVSMGLNFINNNINLKYFAEIITKGLIFSAKEDKDSAYSFLFKILISFTESISKIPNGFSDVKVYYAMYFNYIKEKDSTKASKFVLSLFAIKSRKDSDPFLIEFKFYCISELRDNCTDPDFLSKLDKYEIQTVMDVIDYRNNYTGLILVPNFSEQLSKNINELAQIEKICSEFKKLLDRCIIRDNLTGYNTFLYEMDNCFSKTTQSNRITQSNLYDLYIWAIQRTALLTNRQFSELTFDHIDHCIRELDKNHCVSAKFADKIIYELAKIGQDCTNDSVETTSTIITFLFGLLYEENACNFIVSSPSVKTTLYRGLFNIGTSCIENNYEKGLRSVSNSMGWLAIWSIKSGTYDSTKYLIERASELYSIAKEMEISSKTLTFLLTLFTTIGTYCCKSPKLYTFRDKIISCLNNDSIASVKNAIRLRTSENDMWNDLYKGRTTELTSKFLTEFSKTKHQGN